MYNLLGYELSSTDPSRMARVARFFRLKSVPLTATIPSSEPMAVSIPVTASKRQGMLSQRQKGVR